MFNAVLMMGGLGFIVGTGLALASKIFYVYIDPKVTAIDDILPGANCGGCGMPGCAANAEAIVAGQARPDSCVAAGDDVTKAIANVMGVSIEPKEPELALPGCYYGLDKSDIKFVYDGLSDCRAATLLYGGSKVCDIGCLGLGTCAVHCPFDAIHMGQDGLPIVDNTLCTGCGTCQRICPKNIIKLSSVTIRILEEYTTSDCTAPCQRACPAGINIRKYINLIEKGDYNGAVQVVKERNPFPTVIGRICPRPCENECRRKFVDEPVAINALKRFVADYEKKIGKHILPFKAPKTGRKIAVVGGGVHGLSAAFFSSRLGHEPTVFEATSQLGGLLNKAIVKHRLPDEVLKWDIDGILKSGVNVKTCKTVGLDITMNDLFKNDFKAIFIASGGWDSRLTHANGSKYSNNPVPGVFLLIDFLSKQSFNKETRVNEILCIGGETVIENLLERCIELNIDKINFIFKNKENKDKILSKRYQHNKEITIEVMENMVLTKLIGFNNNLTNVELTNVESGEVKTLNIKTILLSAGRFPEMIFCRPTNKDSIFSDESADTCHGSWIGFPTNKRPDFFEEFGIFAKGDIVSDFDSAIRAISSGRRAAADIHKSMYGIPISLPSNVLNIDSPIQNISDVDGVSSKVRNIIPTSNIQDLNNEFCELEIGFENTVAHMEASRCLQCGLICYKR